MLFWISSSYVSFVFHKDLSIQKYMTSKHEIFLLFTFKTVWLILQLLLSFSEAHFLILCMFTRYSTCLFYWPEHVVPCLCIPTINEVQRLHLDGVKKFFMTNLWVLGCGIEPVLEAPHGWSYTCSGCIIGLDWCVTSGVSGGAPMWRSDREFVRESPCDRPSSLILSSSTALSLSDWNKNENFFMTEIKLKQQSR